MNQVAQGRHALLVFGPSRACKEPIHLPGIEFLDVTFDGPIRIGQSDQLARKRKSNPIILRSYKERHLKLG